MLVLLTPSVIFDEYSVILLVSDVEVLLVSSSPSLPQTLLPYFGLFEILLINFLPLPEPLVQAASISLAYLVLLIAAPDISVGLSAHSNQSLTAFSIDYVLNVTNIPLALNNDQLYDIVPCPVAPLNIEALFGLASSLMLIPFI